MPNDTYGRMMSRGAFPMPKEKPVVTYKSKGKDIELPSERKRDPRLPAEKPSVRKSLEALRGIASKAKQTSDEYQRRNR